MSTNPSFSARGEKKAFILPAWREFDFLRERVNAFFKPLGRKSSIRPSGENRVFSPAEVPLGPPWVETTILTPRHGLFGLIFVEGELQWQ